MSSDHRQEAVHAIAEVDMISATSKLQIEAAEVRSAANRPNWSSYLVSRIRNLIPLTFEFSAVNSFHKMNTTSLLLMSRHGLKRNAMKC